jgi:hypothetical protein
MGRRNQRQPRSVLDPSALRHFVVSNDEDHTRFDEVTK